MRQLDLETLCLSCERMQEELRGGRVDGAAYEAETP